MRGTVAVPRYEGVRRADAVAPLCAAQQAPAIRNRRGRRAPVRFRRRTVEQHAHPAGACANGRTGSTKRH